MNTNIFTFLIIFNIFQDSLTAHIRHKKIKQITDEDSEESQIIIDGPDFQIEENMCVDGLCEHSAQYPVAKIKKILNRVRKYQVRKLFGDVVKPSDRNLPAMFKSLDQETQNVCETRAMKTYPKFLYGDDSKQHWVININNFKQGIEYERCVSDKPKYLNDANGLLNIVYTCEQQYTTIKFWVYNEKTDSLEHNAKKVPTTCACMYRQL